MTYLKPSIPTCICEE